MINEKTIIEFVREIRTSQSEVYAIYVSDECIGRVDLHLLSNSNNVSGLLTLFEEFSDEEVLYILSSIDDNIVESADISSSKKHIGNFVCDVMTVTNIRSFGTKEK